MNFQIDKRNWLRDTEEPTKNYYFELQDGRRGESDTAIQLFDLLANPHYADTDDRVTQIMMLGAMSKDIAVAHFAIRGIRAKVYSGVGLFYDNGQQVYEDEQSEAQAVKFTDDDIAILDFWNEWTCIASMIRNGFMTLYEKVYQIDKDELENGLDSITYFERIFGDENQVEYDGYRKVPTAIFDQDPTWIPHYVRILERNDAADQS